MRHRAIVRGSDRRDDRQRQLEEARQRQPSEWYEVGQVLAVDQLHGDEAQPLGLLHRVDGDDVRVAERGDRLRLALEASQPLGIFGHGVWQHLDGDLPAQSRVEGSVHLTHAADAQSGDDLVAAERGTWLQ